MKLLYLLIIFWLGLFANGYGQKSGIPPYVPVLNWPVDNKELNFKVISSKKQTVTDFWKSKNPLFVSHPDAGYIAPEQPAGNVVEIFEKRTETSRFYVDADTPGKVFTQGSFGPIHYKRNGKWLIIDTRLDKKDDGIYEASHQPEPVGFDLNVKKSYLKTSQGKVFFNDWKLYGTTAKKVEALSSANWENITLGDNGVRIHNIFPGVDAEMQILKGRIKTNLIIREWSFTGYDNFFFSDNFGSNSKGSLSFTDQKQKSPRPGEVDYKVGNKTMARIGKAVAYSESEPENIIQLPYSMKSEELRIHISAIEIKSFLLKGPLVIDPLVVGPETIFKPPVVMNSYNNANCSYDFNEACSYSWQVAIPPNVTITNGSFRFTLETMAPCTRDKMRFRYAFGDTLCKKRIQWLTKDLPKTPGITGGEVSTTDVYNSCFKPECKTTYMKSTLSIIRSCMGPDGCEATCVKGIGPFVTTLEGRSVELVNAYGLGKVTSCNGDTIKLVAKADYGIGPYTYTWTPGNLSGEEVNVFPTTTTTYTITVKDACNQETTKGIMMVVPDLKPPMTVKVLDKSINNCEGQEALFVSEVTNVEKPLYQWRVNNVDVEGATSAQFSRTDLANGDKISLVVTNTDACASLKKVTTEPVIVSVHPGKPYNLPIDLSGCDSVMYNGKTYYQDVSFSEMIKSQFGCDSVNKVVNIKVQHFDVKLSALYDKPLIEGNKVVLKASSNVPNFEIFEWRPAAFFINQDVLEQSFQMAAGNTEYMIWARDPLGCLDTASVSLSAIRRPTGKLLPDIFTPDGDTQNDRWEALRPTDFPVGVLSVYNRWGICVYHTNNYLNPWDGTQNGKRVPAGVYVYKLLIDKEFEINGTVTIVY